MYQKKIKMQYRAIVSVLEVYLTLSID